MRKHTTQRILSALCLGLITTTLASAQSSIFDSEIKSFTEPFRSVDVASTEVGIVKSILIEEGDTVVAGQTGITLNDAVYRASMNLAKANSQSRGSLNTAIATQKIQRSRFDKLTNLQTRRHASASEVEQAKLQLEKANGQVEAAQDEIQIKELEQAKIERQLQQRAVVAPIDGVVVEIRKEIGEFVSPSDPVVFRVVQLSTLKVGFWVPLEKAKGLAAGQSVNLSINRRRTKGKIKFVSPVSDPQSGSSRVKVLIDNHDGKWSAGQSCTLILNQSKQQLVSSRK